MDSKIIFFSAELKSILGHSGKRKAPELLSDGPSFKRQANVHPHLLVSNFFCAFIFEFALCSQQLPNAIIPLNFLGLVLIFLFFVLTDTTPDTNFYG